MRKATDTTLRLLATLHCIPVYPRTGTTRQIIEQLLDMNSEYDVSPRSVQRSLESLSGVFPIGSERRGRENHWFWLQEHALTQIPAMDEQQAFVLRLAAEYLEPLMPRSALRRLAPYFDHADSVLAGTSLGRWIDRTRIIDPGPPLQAPRIRGDVEEAVYAALMENRRLAVDYRGRKGGRAQPIELNPLGIVVRAGVVYLVATSWDYDDVRHYALHRMTGAALLDAPASVPRGFRLDTHIEQDQRFSYPRNPGKLDLHVLFAPEVAIHVTESRLSAKQRTTEQPDAGVLVEATVADTADLRWWLLSFGAAVEVLAPESLRAEFREMATAMAARYG